MDYVIAIESPRGPAYFKDTNSLSEAIAVARDSARAGGGSVLYRIYNNPNKLRLQDWKKHPTRYRFGGNRYE